MKRKSVSVTKKSEKNKKTKSTNKAMNEPTVVIDLHSPVDKDTDGTPIRAVFCLKKKAGMREIEEREECFILDFDPCCDDIVVNNKWCDDASDLSILSEKGQVACRDYPHPRHLCVKNQFDKTPHDRYCELCYCFVCDLAAPCSSWTSNHCHAINNEAWKSVRKTLRTKKN